MRRAQQGLWRHQRKIELGRTTSLRFLQAIRHQEFHHLRRRPSFRKTPASPMRHPSSSTWCISSAQCCGTQGHDTPCPKSSFSCSCWPRASCATTSRSTHQGVSAYPLERVLRSPNSAGRVAEWNIELQTFQLEFSTTRVIKGAALADFVAEWTDAPAL